MTTAINLEAVLATYADGEVVNNAQLYKRLVERGHLAIGFENHREPVGASGKCYSLIKRKVRFHQQTLKHMGLLQRVDRGAWKINADRKGLEAAPAGLRVALFGTDLGFAVWGSCEEVFPDLREPIDAAILSPPYPLAQPRDYGNPDAQAFVDWLCRHIEPIVRNLRPGGNLCVNLSNDIFERGSPARSLYREHLVIALNKRFGLSKMDEIIWHNPCKPPGPVQWASIRSMQLGTGYEPVYVFCNDPLRSLADNRRCLLAHTPEQKKLIGQGGEKLARVSSNGAYRVKQGAYGQQTAGRIARNLLTIRHNDPDQVPARLAAQHLGVPVHAGLMPLELADFLVRFLTAPGGLVVDPFGGYATTARAAEANGRRWIVVEKILQYLLCAKERFLHSDGYYETGLAA